jgi:hypothetical protein
VVLALAVQAKRPLSEFQVVGDLLFSEAPLAPDLVAEKAALPYLARKGRNAYAAKAVSNSPPSR